jgi:hypothetical protein
MFLFKLLLQRQQLRVDALAGDGGKQRVEAVEAWQHALAQRIVEEGREQAHQRDVHRSDDDDDSLVLVHVRFGICPPPSSSAGSASLSVVIMAEPSPLEA